MEYIIAAIAVAWSVLALVHVRQAERRMDRIYDALEVTQRWVSGHGEQIVDLRDELGGLHRRMHIIEGRFWNPDSDAEVERQRRESLGIPVHRTTSKPKPEVRNIDPTPDRSGP